MRRLILTTILAVAAAFPAVAAPRFKTAIVGSEAAPICSSKSLIVTYQLNRLNDPVKADAASAKCGRLAPGSQVAIIYQFGDELAGAHPVQVRPLSPAGAKIGYALTSAFSIAQELASAARN